MSGRRHKPKANPLRSRPKIRARIVKEGQAAPNGHREPSTLRPSTVLPPWPGTIEVHENMATVFRALGDCEKSADHLQGEVRIALQNPRVDPSPPTPSARLLFYVRPPAHPTM